MTLIRSAHPNADHLRSLLELIREAILSGREDVASSISQAVRRIAELSALPYVYFVRLKSAPAVQEHMLHAPASRTHHETTPYMAWVRDFQGSNKAEDYVVVAHIATGEIRTDGACIYLPNWADITEATALLRPPR